MNDKNNFKIFPTRLTWPKAVNDIDIIKNNIESLRLTASFKDIDRLPDMHRLKKLWCFTVNQKFLEYICACRSLENLYIEELKSPDIHLFTKLECLKTLHIDSCSKINTLIPLAELENMTALGITNCKNVHDLAPLSKLVQLEELVIAGGMYTRMKVSTFEPLSNLTNLKFLHLTNIKAEDESLKPLGQLNRLTQLDIANFYPIEEFAWLSAKLKDTHCTWFQPYIDFAAEKCKKCGKNTMVMLSGKGTSRICKRCDSDKLAKHRDNFLMIKNNSR